MAECGWLGQLVAVARVDPVGLGGVFAEAVFLETLETRNRICRESVTEERLT